MTGMWVLQKLAYDWGVRCFGKAHMTNVPLRALRLAEEAIELAQAAGVPKDKMLNLVEVVYRRPPGNLMQELGGVMVTASVLCEAKQRTLEDVFMTEVQRCLSKPTDHFAQRNQEKLELGLTG